MSGGTGSYLAGFTTATDLFSTSLFFLLILAVTKSKTCCMSVFGGVGVHVGAVGVKGLRVEASFSLAAFCFCMVGFLW